jgi:small subunit ribosomal protein S4
VNEKRVNIPSYLVRPGDIIGLKATSKKLNIVEENISKMEHRGLPGWVEMDTNNLKGKILHAPSRDEIELPIQEQLIVELYSK